MTTLADIYRLMDMLSEDGTRTMRVERCPSCGTWSTLPYYCQRCGKPSVRQSEYLTRIASGPQPARLSAEGT